MIFNSTFQQGECPNFISFPSIVYNESIKFKYKIKMKSTNNPSQLNGYIIGKTIGKGTFGKVKQAKHKLTGQYVAIKFLEKQKIKDITDVERVSRELHFLKIVRHPAIAQLYQIIQTPKMIYIIMEYAAGGQFFDYIMDKKVKSEQQSFWYFSQIISALIYLHSLGICHRDVKPENMLMDSDNKIKLVDFGLSNMYKKGEKLSTACGSPCYASPEMIKGQNYDPQLTDIWSLGVVLYTSVMAQLPFQDENTNSLYSKIKAGLYMVNKKLSPQLKDLLSKLINIKPESRIHLKEISSHPWCTKFSKRYSLQGINIGYQSIPIDKNVVEEMETFEFQPKKTTKYLQSNVKNQCTTTYYLLLKRKLKSGKGSQMDICCDKFQKKSVTPYFSLKQKRYKSLDFNKIIQNQNKENLLQRNNRNCISQPKYRYSQTQKVTISLKSNSKKKTEYALYKPCKSIQNFLKNQASVEIKRKISKDKSIRNKSLSVSTQKPDDIRKYLSDLQDKQRLSGQKLKAPNKGELFNKRRNIDDMQQIYRPFKIKQKQQPTFAKQKAKQFDMDISNVFWRKKSTTVKPITGTSAEYTRGVRKHINF